MRKDKGLVFAIILLALYILPPIIIWFGIIPFSERFQDFSSGFLSLGRLSGLVGFSLFALTFLFSARLKFFDSIFAGLNNVYIRHHHIGAVAFIFLMVHPLTLAIRFVPTSVQMAAIFLTSSFTDGTILYGTLGLLLMTVLLIVTLYFKWRYHRWKMSHQFLSVAFILGFAHMMVISSDVSDSIALKLYLILLSIIAFASIVYRTLFHRQLVSRYVYKIKAVERLNSSVIIITMESTDKEMKYEAGQYAFFSFENKVVSKEQHPFSIASAPHEKDVKIIVKNLGDYTDKIQNIQPGTRVVVEGPYGTFLKNVPAKQVWIAGGIGVTPFLSKAGALSPNEDVAMFYSVNQQKEAVCLDVLKDVAKKNPFFKVYSWYTAEQGRITAIQMKEKIRDWGNRDYYLCGPVPMMKALRRQLVDLGIKNDKIHSEEFALIQK